jgi:hypothetical protein
MLNPAEIMAMAKAIKETETKGARQELTAGSYPVDVTVRISGQVSVGEDTTRAATSNLLSQEFLLLVLHKAGFMREQAMDLVQSTAQSYLKEWTGTDEDRKRAKRMREDLLKEFDPEGKMKAFLAETKVNLPRVPVQGSVRFAGTVEVVEEATSEALRMVG